MSILEILFLLMTASPGIDTRIPGPRASSGGAIAAPGGQQRGDEKEGGFVVFDTICRRPDIIICG